MKRYLIVKSLITAERLNQDKILELVNEESYTVEEAEEMVGSNCNYVELDNSDEIYEHLDYISANSKTEAYEKYKEKKILNSRRFHFWLILFEKFKKIFFTLY